MKQHQPSPSSWDFYTTSIKEFLARALTKKEYSLMMQGYIGSKPWQEMAKELEKKMKLTDKEKERVHLLYSAWVDGVSHDLEDKTYFSVEEIVSKVIEIVENVKGEEE